jgi:hypothetical protein
LTASAKRLSKGVAGVKVTLSTTAVPGEDNPRTEHSPTGSTEYRNPAGRRRTVEKGEV